MTYLKQLQKMFPTKKDLLEARKKYESWRHMAVSLAISQYALVDYRKQIGIEPWEMAGKREAIRDINQKEIDERLSELSEGGNTYRKYKITDPDKFYANPLGYEGLEFIGEEHGKTWRSVEYLKCLERESIEA